ncbi:MAG: apolipoprotein N-acyltransferase [Alphaproteobacteria bacterium]|nr:apolipoprotein N-acyltransferase [Alphaproteobacteria bacterium]
MPEATALRVHPGARVATPLCRFAQEIAALTGWRRYGVAILLGALLACALPPIDMTPVVFLVFPSLLWLDNGSASPWASARLGYVFGISFFVAGLYWIAAAMFVDIARFWWALPFAVLGLPAYLAFYPAAAMGLTTLMAVRLRLSPLGRVLLFTAAWSAAEWGRGHLLTGFPWNLVGYVWSGGFPGALTVLQTTAWVGIYGLTLLTVLAASLPALLGTASLEPLAATRRVAPLLTAIGLIAALAATGSLRLSQTPTVLTATWLRLVQPSIPETMKWDPNAAEENFHRLIELSSGPADHPLAAIIWPEAAVPFLLDRDAAHRRAVGAVAPANGYVLTGDLRGNPAPDRVSSLWNSVEVIDSGGAIRANYDKAHLVPFGEYMPLANVLPLHKITPGPIDLSAGPGPQSVALPGLPPFSPNVCYEVIFSASVVAESVRPAWILNVTNDAWYGRSSGPYQHFAIARTRAIEEGLPLVRAANNGISGVVDAAGRVLAHTGLDSVGYADVALPEAAQPTLYSKHGDWLFLAMLVMCLLPALRLRGQSNYS